MRCWGVVLRKFRSAALVSVSTAISFALLRGREKTGLGADDIPHMKTDDGRDRFEIRGFGPIFSPSLVQQAEPSSLWITYRAFPRYVYPPSYAVHVAYICLHFLQICHRLLLEEDESTAFQVELFIPRRIYIRDIARQRILLPMKTIGEMESIQFASRFYSPTSLRNRFYTIKRSQFNPYGMPSI